MKIRHRAKEVVVGVDKDIIASTTRGHDWHAGCHVVCPSIYSRIWRSTADVEIACRCDKEAVRFWYRTRDSSFWCEIAFSPCDNEVARLTDQIDGVICSDKDIIGIWTELAGRRKRYRRWIPCCIGTKYRLIVRNSYKQSTMQAYLIRSQYPRSTLWFGVADSSSKNCGDGDFQMTWVLFSCLSSRLDPRWIMFSSVLVGESEEETIFFFEASSERTLLVKTDT